MFSLNNFIMKTLKGMIGNYPDFQVSEYALNWYSKGKLTEDDLAAIDASIEAQYIVPEPPVVEGTEMETEGTEEPTEIVEETDQEEPTPEATE